MLLHKHVGEYCADARLWEARGMIYSLKPRHIWRSPKGLRNKLGSHSHPLLVGAHVVVLLGILVACAPAPFNDAAQRPSPTGVPAARLARLARCVDVARWFWEVSDPSPHHFTSYLSDSDLALIHQLGFTCVRLSVDPNLIYHKASPSKPDRTVLTYVDDAVRRFLAHDLGVIIDIHDDPDKPLETDPDWAAGFAQFWRALAHHYSGWDANMVFLEVLNEPVFQQAPTRWLPIQQKLLNAMRAGAPNLTLIATGPLWSSVSGLLLVRPVADRNIVYTFHFYDPQTFTHQGAEWWVDGLDRYMHGLPFPVAPARCAAAVATFTNADVRQSARLYCAGQWDASKVTALIAQAAHWSTVNHVPIIAGEFGVYSKHVSTTDRLAWFHTVHAAFSKYGIGWNLWAYDDSYGLARQPDHPGAISIDWGVVKVLGLNVGARKELSTGS